MNMGETIVNMAIGAREVIVHLKGRTFGNRQMANMAKHMVQQEFLKMHGEIRSKYCKILAWIRQDLESACCYKSSLKA